MRNTVVGRAESRRVEYSSQDWAVGRYGILYSLSLIEDNVERLNIMVKTWFRCLRPATLHQAGI